MSGPSVRVYWSIEYDGPRRPFSVLTPTLEFMSAGQTTAHFWYPRPDGKADGFKIAAGALLNRPLPKQKGWFSIATDGNFVTGKIIVGNGNYLKGYFGRLSEPGDPPLWVQLEHAPTDRGDANAEELGFKTDRWTLDAWTGHLWSPVVEVAVK